MTSFICPFFGPIPPEYQRCIGISRATVEAAGHVFDLRVMPEITNPADACIAKDRYVLDLARHSPDAAFLDADIEVYTIPNLQPGRPYFIREWDTPRIGYFFVNGCTQWFKDLQAEKERRGIQDVYGYPNKLLRYKEVGIIPEETYFHHRFTSDKIHKSHNLTNRS